jgi:hypothetical protein
VVIGSRDAVYMVMEFVEHDLKYVLELQSSKKSQPFSIGQVRRTPLTSYNQVLMLEPGCLRQGPLVLHHCAEW